MLSLGNVLRSSPCPSLYTYIGAFSKSIFGKCEFVHIGGEAATLRSEKSISYHHCTETVSKTLILLLSNKL